jgi:hypothetical protein
MLPHETNRNWKPLLKTTETGYVWTKKMREPWALPGFDEVPLLRPSDVWTKKMREPWQPKRFEWWLLDLTEVK